MSSADAITNLWRIENVWFANHATDPGAQQIRDKARTLALSIIQHAPNGADQQAALRKVREAVATAEMAISCGGK